ncbi:hypothetical protein L9F63_003535, partial [Diploptera punctata]
FSGAVGIQITDLRVPPAVRNNSGSGALLDCEYTLKSDELAADAYSGLVVKWYFNNSPSPVYQWIPGQKPQDLGILKGKLDLNYRASEHAATMHRALYIPNPTTELSGEYKCLVSTFSDEDFMTKKMVVFVYFRNLFHEKYNECYAQISGSVREYPKRPTLVLSQSRSPVMKHSYKEVLSSCMNRFETIRKVLDSGIVKFDMPWSVSVHLSGFHSLRFRRELASHPSMLSHLK